MVGVSSIDVFGLGLALDGLDGAAHDRPEVEAVHVETELAGDDAADVEQIGDQLRLQAGVARHHVEAALHELVVAAAAGHQLGPAENGVQRRAQLVRHHRDEVVLHPARALGFGAGGAFRFEQAVPLDGGPFRAADVAHDLRGADDPARRVAHRRHGQRYLHQVPVLRPPHGLEMIDAVAAANAADDRVFLLLTIGRDEDANRLSDQLRRGVAEQPLRGGVARAHDPVEILRDDGVVG